MFRMSLSVERQIVECSKNIKAKEEENNEQLKLTFTLNIEH